MDGNDPEQKSCVGPSLTSAAFSGKYPQVFIRQPDGQHTFVGDWDEFEGLLDSDWLPPEVRNL